jgi:hypothetical protein
MLQLPTTFRQTVSVRSGHDFACAQPKQDLKGQTEEDAGAEGCEPHDEATDRAASTAAMRIASIEPPTPSPILTEADKCLREQTNRRDQQRHAGDTAP